MLYAFILSGNLWAMDAPEQPLWGSIIDLDNNKLVLMEPLSNAQKSQLEEQLKHSERSLCCLRIIGCAHSDKLNTFFLNTLKAGAASLLFGIACGPTRPLASCTAANAHKASFIGNYIRSHREHDYPLPAIPVLDFIGNFIDSMVLRNEAEQAALADPVYKICTIHVFINLSHSPFCRRNWGNRFCHITSSKHAVLSQSGTSSKN